MRQVLVVKSGGAAVFPEWQAAFAACAPDLDLRWWDDPALDPAAVDFALVWDPEPGRLAQLPNLKVIFGSGAGVDAIIADPDLPRHLPLVRMGVEGAAQRMGEYACWAALSLLRDIRRLAIAQAERRWDYFEPDFTARDKVVGIMGLSARGGLEVPPGAEEAVAGGRQDADPQVLTFVQLRERVVQRMAGAGVDGICLGPVERDDES